MIGRREFIAGLGGVVAWPQPPPTLPVTGSVTRSLPGLWQVSTGRPRT